MANELMTMLKIVSQLDYYLFKTFLLLPVYVNGFHSVFFPLLLPPTTSTTPSCFPVLL